MHVTAFQTRNEKATEAPYKVSYHNALAGKVHAIVEGQIKSCIVDIAECLLDEKNHRTATFQWFSYSE